MNNCALICEYNPFHTGHKYQLDAIRNAGADNILCVMSGQFVQSGLPAFCDKSIRAECAILGGADAVIELPTVYSTANAQYFAEGAIKIISSIKGVTHLAMGVVAEPDVLKRIAEIKTDNSERLKSALLSIMDGGKSYNAAMTDAICEIYSDTYGDGAEAKSALTDPNNILSIEYISALYKHAPNIEPLCIRRVGGTYNDTTLGGEYVSATAIRQAEARGKLSDAQRYIPFNFDKIAAFRANNAPDIAHFKKSAAFAAKSLSPAQFANLRNCSEGLENKFAGLACNDYDGISDSVVGKRYGKKRIARLMLDSLLGIDKSALDKPFITRLLGCKQGFDFSTLPSFVFTNNADIKRTAQMNAYVADVLAVDERASLLYNILCGNDGGYYNYSLVKV